MRFIITLLAVIIPLISFNQHIKNEKIISLIYQENKGQWDSNVIYKTKLGHGDVF